MSADKKNPPVIKKIIKKGHGGHHGGSWKVAYADFVTAMMAFFLVMWLLAISSEQGKAALSEYFENLTVTDAVFNGGQPTVFEGENTTGVLSGGCYDLNQKGRELEERAAKLDEREKSLLGGDDRLDAGAARPTNRDQDPDLTDLPAGEEGGEGSDQTGVAPGGGYEDVEAGFGAAVEDAQAQAAKESLMHDLTESVAGGLGGAGLAETDLEGQFLVDTVPGGIRIQIMDKEGQPIFLSGQPRLTPLAMVVLGTVAERLMTVPNKMAIEGHTDSVQTSSQELTNWELSTARASAARRFLARHGITDDRLTMVAGYASTRPLPNTNPTDPVNRRIAVVIWDEPVKADPAPKAEPETPPEATAPAAGSSETPAEPPAARPTYRPRRRPAPQRPSQESLEQMLLEETLRRASEPDGSSDGPPL